MAAVWLGSPYPVGASWDGQGVNFALFSEHAEKVELCLFDPQGRRETERIMMPDRTDEVWHGYFPEARPGLLYGYRAYGPYAPGNPIRSPAARSRYSEKSTPKYETATPHAVRRPA